MSLLGFGDVRRRRASIKTKAFQKWFGDSVVTDFMGKPEIVYHGTQAEKPFSVFRQSDDEERMNIGFHFGSTIAQAFYRISGNTFDGYDAGIGVVGAHKRHMRYLLQEGRILEFYLSLQNPLFAPDLMSWSAGEVAKFLQQQKMVKASYVTEILDLEEQNVAGALEEVRNLLEYKLGFDGFVYQNEIEGAGKSYVVLAPNQIKSVYNNGTWSTSPDVFAGLRSR